MSDQGWNVWGTFYLGGGVGGPDGTQGPRSIQHQQARRKHTQDAPKRPGRAAGVIGRGDTGPGAVIGGMTEGLAKHDHSIRTQELWRDGNRRHARRH